jgi:hypothetical protein
LKKSDSISRSRSSAWADVLKYSTMVPFECVTIKRHLSEPTALISQRTISEPTMKKLTIVRHHRKRGADMHLHVAAHGGTGTVRKRHKRTAPMVQFRHSWPHGRPFGRDAQISSRPG